MVAKKRSTGCDRHVCSTKLHETFPLFHLPFTSFQPRTFCLDEKRHVWLVVFWFITSSFNLLSIHIVPSSEEVREQNDWQELARSSRLA